jgi:hypothetical protein
MIKKFNEGWDEEKGWDDEESSDRDYDLYDDDYYGHVDDTLYDVDDEIESVLSYIRGELKSKKIRNSYVDSQNINITISVIRSKREKLSEILEVFSFIENLKEDILTNYTLDYDIYETIPDGNSSAECVLEFVFYSKV